MTTLFISDLHLQGATPEIGEQLLGFLAGPAREADAFYILGDLFEAWLGDDDPDPHYAEIERAMRAFSDTGVPCYFMHGNRDFLVGPEFSRRTGFELLGDPVVREIEGTRVLISHGDRYCTDDVEYQAVRRQLRDPAWQAQVLALPIEHRRKMAGDARAESAAANQLKAADIMDVNQQAVERALQDANATTMLHGHTHRPALHEFRLPDGSTAHRYVLGDWYEQGSVGRWDAAGFQLQTLVRT
jgi:UDP-2,3-diacylglucosamine hydrolase